MAVKSILLPLSLPLLTAPHPSSSLPSSPLPLVPALHSVLLHFFCACYIFFDSFSDPYFPVFQIKTQQSITSPSPLPPPSGIPLPSLSSSITSCLFYLSLPLTPLYSHFISVITPTVVTPPPVLPAATVPRSPRRDIWDENVRCILPPPCSFTPPPSFLPPSSLLPPPSSLLPPPSSLLPPPSSLLPPPSSLLPPPSSLLPPPSSLALISHMI